MATGFEKFANKTLSEEPIKLGGEPVGNPETEREKRGGERRSTTTARQSTRHIAMPKEDMTQITIKIKTSTKDKLDWLKFTQKRKIMELVEEAIEDIYIKYGGK